MHTLLSTFARLWKGPAACDTIGPFSGVLQDLSISLLDFYWLIYTYRYLPVGEKGENEGEGQTFAAGENRAEARYAFNFGRLDVISFYHTPNINTTMKFVALLSLLVT